VKRLFAACALILVGVLYVQWRSWPPAPPQAAAAQQGNAPAAIPGDQVPAPEDLLLPPPPKEDYASIVERPLFLPDRRPPPDEPEEQEPTEPEAPSDLDGTDLTAVIITPAAVSAWVRPPKSKETERLRLGDDFQGWTVKTIEADRLVFERQGETNEVILRDYAHSPPTVPPRTPITRRQPGNRPRGVRRPPAAPAKDQQAEPSTTTTAGPSRAALRRPRDER
jgi:general secretion pathway protein N